MSVRTFECLLPSRRTISRLPAMLLGVAMVALPISGCDPVADPGPSATGPKGIYVVNEGSFTASNAELSYINEDRTTASGAVFSSTNSGKVLGDIAQHAQEAGGRVYVVMNSSRTIEVIEAGTHRWLRTIPLARAPRAIDVVSPVKAYVTNMDSTVSILDLVTGSVVRDITVGSFPEGLVHASGRLYVFNGGWGYGSTISVIDLPLDSVTATVPSPSGPTHGVIGTGGRLHVLCTGAVGFGGAADIPAAVVTIDPNTGAIVDTLHLSQPAGRMAADAAGDLYVTRTGTGGSGVWKLTGGAAPSVVSSSLVTGEFYGIGVDRDRSELYLSVAGDFVSNGSVQVHTLSGAPVRSYTSGIGVAPNGFVFLP